jgi:mxaK protein
MRRHTLHALFALATLAVAALVASEVLRLRQQQSLADAIGQAAASGPQDPSLDARLKDAPREVRLARATALSRHGEAEAATRLYSALVEPGRVDEIGRAALLGLGNLHLRQALALTANDAAAGPLVELAKQRYRDLLRLSPQDWDARHNLERALRLAPEEQEAVAEPDNEPVERRNVQLRGMKAGDLP